jgi:hypothetical protein
LLKWIELEQFPSLLLLEQKNANPIIPIEASAYLIEGPIMKALQK